MKVAGIGKKAISFAGTRSYALAKNIKNRMAGKNENKYADGKEDKQDSKSENDIKSE